MTVIKYTMYLLKSFFRILLKVGIHVGKLANVFVIYKPLLPNWSSMQIKTAMKVLFSLDETYILRLPIDSIKPFGIKYMLSPCCIFDGVVFCLLLWKNMVFDKTRTYSLTHTWFIKIHTYIWTILSLMRRKHEVNIIWIDSTILHSHITYHIYKGLCSFDTFVCKTEILHKYENIKPNLRSSFVYRSNDCSAL